MKILASPFNVLRRWDFKSALAEHFRIEHPDFVPLSTFAEEATALVAPSSEPEKRWPMYGVSNRQGVFFSHKQLGKDFKGNVKRIQKDWFFHNPTRANIGSIGRVPTVPEDAITSPEYQVWRPKSGVDPAYIEVLVKSRLFLSLIEIHRVGAVKERLFVSNLLQIPVPNLSKSEQKAFIKDVQSAKRELANAHAQLETAWRSAEQRLASLVSEEYQAFAASPDVEEEEEGVGSLDPAELDLEGASQGSGK